MPNLSREDMNPGPADHPDSEVEHPDEGRGIPQTIDTIRAAVKTQLDDADADLAKLRGDRDALNLRIRDAVQARDEIAKIVRQLTPKTPRTRKPKTEAK